MMEAPPARGENEMILKRFYDDNLAQASYLIGCGATGEALIKSIVEPTNSSGLRRERREPWAMCAGFSTRASGRSVVPILECWTFESPRSTAGPMIAGSCFTATLIASIVMGPRGDPL